MKQLVTVSSNILLAVQNKNSYCTIFISNTFLTQPDKQNVNTARLHK